MDNPLKKSFPLEVKEEDDDNCGCNHGKANLNEAFDQSQGAASFLNEEPNVVFEDQDSDDETVRNGSSEQYLLNEEEETSETQQETSQKEEVMGETVGGVDILDAVLEDQVNELAKLDKLAEQVLNS